MNQKLAIQMNQKLIAMNLKLMIIYQIMMIILLVVKNMSKNKNIIVNSVETLTKDNQRNMIKTKKYFHT